MYSIFSSIKMKYKYIYDTIACYLISS